MTGKIVKADARALSVFNKPLGPSVLRALQACKQLDFSYEEAESAGPRLEPEHLGRLEWSGPSVAAAVLDWRNQWLRQFGQADASACCCRICLPNWILRSLSKC
jgi:hypothetical protein